MTTACSRGSPVAGSKRAGRPVVNRASTPSRSMPMTPSCGPVMPTSVMYAVPPRQDALVGGLHVRVRADHRGDASVEEPAHRQLSPTWLRRESRRG